jgi:hypothetical protein
MNARTQRMLAWGFMVGATALLGTSLFAWQSGLAAIGKKDSDLTEIAQSYFATNSPGALPGIYSLTGPIRSQWKAKGGAERAQEVRDLCAIAKKYVSTPEFAKMYNEWIKNTFHAVDHGIKVDPQADAAKMMTNGGAEQMMSQVAAAMVKALEQAPPEVVKGMYDADMKSWKDSSDKAKLYAKGKQIEPLFKSNPAEWKKQYLLLKSADMGGPSTEAGLAAANAATTKSAADQKLRDEQQAYNDHQLKVALKKKLQEFTTVARSLDFAAQTKGQGTSIVFVNPMYERKPSEWKMLFRLGKDPVMAAVAFAEQWAKEL